MSDVNSDITHEFLNILLFRYRLSLKHCNLSTRALMISAVLAQQYPAVNW